MQTIENSLLHAAVDENGAQLLHLSEVNGKYDFFVPGSALKIVFPENDHDLTGISQWTVVDKGDARMSLTLLDNEASRKIFPFHFELIVTYALEGEQLTVTFYVKNHSDQAMPFSLLVNLPLPQEAKVELNPHNATISDQAYALKAEANDFTLELHDGIQASFGSIDLAPDMSQQLSISLILKQS
ncbi:aldose epimerase family protein [Lactobacillus corticis]|uniref:Aldose 1-epimerase n=1 Tax=Lactobacillus corticis TaxID=2201249 RepID=A0A916QJR3_9LACO|nr:aldose epimerase [Lactobacillus corticis]GFZ26913.1 aldose 1-epimerase [Lactobacillus corticis]